MTEPTQAKLGRYRILAELGRGAMGIVYRAEDTLLNRTVAVKTIVVSSDAQEREEYEARFYQEAKAAGGLNHPNIITIHDMGRDADVLYMAMELLEGVELKELMRKHELPLPLAIDLAAQIADGLAFAHERGVVHRDIKPANVMVVHGTYAKIMDFGIAKARLSDVKTQVGSLLGSPKYMSPEQVSGTRADHRSDIFSLGVTIYEMVTGVAPFTGADVGQLMYQISTATPQPPSSLSPGLPTMLDLILARALEKDPEKRYQSARELAADLRACRAQIHEPQLPSGSAAAPAPLDLELAQTEPFEKTVELNPAPSERTLTAQKTVNLQQDTQTGMSPASGVAQGTDAAQTVSARGASAPSTAMRLLVSRRFDSTAALHRLGTDDSPAQPSIVRPMGWLSDRLHRQIAAGIVLAIMVALAIALL